ALLHSPRARETCRPALPLETAAASRSDSRCHRARHHAACVWLPTPKNRSDQRTYPAPLARWSSCHRPKAPTGRRCAPMPSLQILQLLAQLLELPLHPDHRLRDARVVGLGADRVDLAQQLLRQKAELFADRVIGAQRLARR